MRVPLINPIKAVIYRLDIQAIWAADPAGDPAAGYDPTLREPYITDVDGVRTTTRVEMAAVKVPCQVETQSFEQLNAVFGGDDPVTDVVFVAHRQDLKKLSLLDATTRKCLLKPGDRIAHIERKGHQVLAYEKPLYIYEVRPRSWGFGPDGYDLEVLYTTYRAATQ